MQFRANHRTPNAPKRARSFLAGAVLAAALSGCATGKIWSHEERTETDNSPEQPVSEKHTAILKRSGIAGSSNLQNYVTTVGKKVAAASDCPKGNWTFTVLDSPQAQAFSMPGGYVYINRGMLEMLRSESDLAAVLAHEVAHVCTRDVPRHETTTLVALYGNLGLLAAINPWALLGVLYVPEIALLPAAGTMAGLSRHDEFNADRHGAQYLRRAGYLPEGMSEVMEVLADLEAYDQDRRKKGERVLGRPAIPMGRVYDDHPSAAKRMAKLARAGASVPTDSEFLARLDGLEFGATKAEGTTPMLRVRRVQEGDTFASLAKSARIPDAEAQLRLLNTRYPSGELEVGQLVKVIE